jgi:hypothetical protein
MQITWFRHAHEARNDYFRYALMKQHLNGALTYREFPQKKGRDFGLSDELVQHDHRHTSILRVDHGSRSRLVAIDNEDGFIHMQTFIEEVDAYFCCPFTPAFHREKKFPPLLPWQTDTDVASYRAKASDLIERYGEHFGKVRRLAPTPTRLADFGAMSQSEWRTAVWKHRFRRLQVWKDDRELWRHDYAACEARYNQMLSYRDLSLHYDVVCRESLWGWPDNRIDLHKRLHALREEGHEVYSQLTPASDEQVIPPRFEVTEENRARLDALMEPMGLEDGYETALGRSRLAVFPTGFHWGWRGIMFLGLCAGLPTLMDRPIYEPYFDFDAFKVAYNEGTWEKTRELVNEIDEQRWKSIKQENQEVFDQYLSPEGVGEYLHGELRRLLSAEAKKEKAAV